MMMGNSVPGKGVQRQGKKWTGRRNIVHYVTKQYMRLNRKRTLTTFIGIVFMVLLMTCVFVGKDTAIAYLQEAASQKNGKWHYAMYNVTKEQEKQAEQLGYVRELSESVELGMTDFSLSTNDERPYLNVKAYGTECFDWYNIKVLSGRLPERADELIVSAACLDDGVDIRPGDRIDATYFERFITGTQKDGANSTIFPYYGLEVEKGKTVKVPQGFPYFGKNDSFEESRVMTGKQQSYTVVGIMEIPSFEEKTAAGYTALTLLDEETLNEADTVNVSMLVDSDAAPIMDLFEIAGEENVEANDIYLAFSGDSTDSTMNLMVNLMTLFFVILVMCASVILIYNVFNLSFRERSQYLGMLSSVGATARQKRGSIYYEAFHLLITALPLGLLLGFGVVYAGMQMLQPYITRFIYTGLQMERVPVTLVVSWKALLAVVAVSILTVLVSAFLPARKIGKSGAVDSIRGNEGTKNRVYRMRRRMAGRFPAEKMLAGNTIVRQRRKKRSISLAIIIFLVILLVTAFGADTIHIVLENKTANASSMEMHLLENEYGLYYLPGAAEDEEDEEKARAQYDALKEELSKRSDVKYMREWYDSMFLVSVDSTFYSEEYWNAYRSIAKAYLGKDMTDEEITKQYISESGHSSNILVVDDDTLKDMAKLCGADYDMLKDGEQMGCIIINETTLSTDTLVFDEGRPERYLYYDIEQVSDLKSGDSFLADIYSEQTEQVEQIEFTVSGYADNDQLSDYVTVNGEWPWLIISRQTARKLAQTCGYKDVSEIMDESLHIGLEGENQELAEYLRNIADNSSEHIGFATEDNSELEKSIIGAIADIVDIMLVCFVILTSVICLMNLVNSIHGRMADRRKDFAVLQSVGMTRTQLRRMLLFECAGILAEAAVIAVVIATVLIWGIRYVLSSLFGHLALHIPYLMIVSAALVTTAAVIFITLYSFGKEKKENLLEHIRNESV